MIIKSIEIQNFLSYYGDQELKFGKGATIIIGQNNTGKSKLFDAYNWVLYDEAFKTEAENWEGTPKWGHELVNRLAKAECSIGKSLECSVCLEFEDDKMNHFLVTREYRIKRTSKDEWQLPEGSELQITTKEAGTYNTETFVSYEAKEILERYFPKNLSRYFLFQGESISSLMRLNQRSDFNRAIRELSGIKFFQKAERYAKSVQKRVSRDFQNKGEKDRRIQEEKDRLSKETDSLKEEVSETAEKLENHYRERAIIEEKLDEKVAELSRYEECASILQKIKESELLFEGKVKELKDLFELQRNDLITKWLYGKSDTLFDQFLTMYRQARDSKQIPEPMRQDFIQQMLDDFECKVCGTKAPVDSREYKLIASHRSEKSLEEEVAVINTLSDAADGMKMALQNLPKELKKFQEKKGDIIKERERLQASIERAEDELRIVIERLYDEEKIEVSRDGLEKINIKKVKKERDQFKTDLRKADSKIDRLAGRKEQLDKNLKNKEEDYAKLIDKSSNEVEKLRMQLATEIRDQVTNLYGNFLSKLISDIEEETNTYFTNMTRSNTALSGSVRVNYEERDVYPVDENNERMTNINQANKVSLQISFIAAVLSVSNRIWDKYFPFVSDAPISALGGNNKISAIKTMIDIFRQSIIIIKDDANTDSQASVDSDQVRQLIKNNERIGYAYELSMIGDNIEGQNTKITELK